jgi:hypothetical protein
MARLLCNEGEGVFVNFVGDEEWHARVILDVVGPSLYVVLTPDADIYTEDFSVDGGDVSSVRSRGWEVEVPFGIPLDQVYDFAAFPSDAQLRMLLAEGRQEGDRERVVRGMPPLGARAPYEAPAVPRGTWCAAAGRCRARRGGWARTRPWPRAGAGTARRLAGRSSRSSWCSTTRS